MRKLRKLSLFLVIVLTLALILTGCGQKSEAPKDTPKETPKEAEKPAPSKNVRIGTGGTAGIYFAMGGGLAQLLTDNGFNSTAQTTGASVENMRLIESKDLELTFSQNDIAYYAYHGQEIYKEKLDSARALVALFPEVIQIVVPADSDIQSLEDLKGKKVAVGAAGSGGEANARQILNAAGVTYSDFKQEFVGYGEAADYFKDRLIDAMFVTGGVPHAAIQNVAATQAIRLIPVGADITSKLLKDNPFYVETTIPAGSYTGLTADTPAVNVVASLFVHKDIDDETVYEITKILFGNLDKLKPSHVKWESVSLEHAKEGLAIPFHPGALKFYEEKGIK